MANCKYCGSDKPLESCPERGEIICTDCGAVCNENNIVTEVSFDKESGGAAVFGQLLYADGLTSYERRKLGKSTAGQTKKRMSCLGAKLRLSSSSIETGFSFYKLAMSQGLLRGYRNKVADAVLLYITCRLEGTPHMLMDFSDVLRVHLFTLGKLFLKLTRDLHLTLPQGDPWQYILRFSSKLSLGDRTHEVATTALRMVARMKRDWMNTGRHPCGLYGAAIFVAARLSGFKIHMREISRVVSLHPSTIKKRLSEFQKTPSCALTIDEFFRVDLLREEEPPSFQRSQARKCSQFDSDSEEDDKDLAYLSVSRKGLSVDETIAKARYLQKLKDVAPLPLQPSSQSELERFSVYAENGEELPKVCDEDELDLTGLDDVEIDKCLLTKEETEEKTEIWNAEFGQYEEELRIRTERRSYLESKAKQSIPKKKRTLEVEVSPASSTREVLQQVIDKTGLQDRLDLGTLLGEGTKENFGGEQQIDLTEEPITIKDYESTDSDANKTEYPFYGDDVTEQEMFFEDYDIR